MGFFGKKTQGASGSAASLTSNDTSLHNLDSHSEKDNDDVAISMNDTPSRGSSAVEQKSDGAEKDLALEQQVSQDYPHGFKLFLITVALALSVFCLALDNTIISTAIPRITDQ